MPRTFSGKKGELFRSHLRELADPDQPRLIERFGHLRPDAWEPLGFQRAKEITLIARGHLQEARWLFQFRGDRADQLVAGDTLGNRDFQALADGLPNNFRDFPSGAFPIAAQVEIALVYRGDFDRGREVVGVAEHEAAEPLILLKIARNHDKARTNLPRSSSWHCGVDAELAGFVAGGCDDAPRCSAGRAPKIMA